MSSMVPCRRSAPAGSSEAEAPLVFPGGGRSMGRSNASPSHAPTASWSFVAADCTAAPPGATPCHTRQPPRVKRRRPMPTQAPDPGKPSMNPRSWEAQAIRKIEADFNRSADTHLIPVPLPAFPGVHLYLKDESSHPTGSLKHRLARSLFLYALCNGWLHRGSTVVEASSGSTAVSEAYFARLIGLPFMAVIPKNTSREKVAAIEFYGGQIQWVESGHAIYGESERLAREL